MDHYGTYTEVACFSLLQKNFIKYLLHGTKNLSPQFAITNNETISHIINCSTGIFLLSLKKCDIEINPNPPVGSNGCALITAKNSDTYCHDYGCYSWVNLHFFPSFQSLFEDILEIFRTISELLGSETSETFVFRHLTGTVYQSRWVPLTCCFSQHLGNCFIFMFRLYK